MNKPKGPVFIGGGFKAAEPSSSDFIMTISGYASTRDLDRVGDIVEPSAFNNSLSNFEKFPVLLLNHEWDNTPIGKVTNAYVDDRGLFIEAGIIDTPRGREVKALIEADILRSFSIGFNIKKWEMGSEPDDPFRITELELLEISVVNVPANMAALITEATAKGLNLSTIKTHNPREGWGTKGVIGLEPTQVKTMVEDSLKPIGEKVKDVEVKVSELGSSFEKMAKFEKDLKDITADGTKTSGELRQLIEKAQGDFTKNLEDLSKEIAAVKANKGSAPSWKRFETETLKSMVMRQPSELRGSLPRDDADRIQMLQKAHDKVVLVDALLAASSKSTNGSYHRRDKFERIKGLGVYREFAEFAKAMDSSTSGEGSDWIPTMVSGDFIELVKLEQKVMPLFTEIIMPGDPFVIDTEGADTIAKLIGQKTAVISAFDSNEETPGTSSITFNAKKARGRYQISRELTEDSAVAILPFATRKIILSIARAEDRAGINGDLTTGGTATFDSGYTVATTDFRHAWDGLRYHWFNNVKSAATLTAVDLSTFNETNVRKVRAGMGKYGLYPSELAWITGITGYLLRLLNDLDNYQTLDKYGPNAVILSGELMKVDNAPVIVSEWVEETQDSDGIYSAAGNAKTSLICVNRNMWLRGTRRGVEVEVERDLINDVYQMVAFKRSDFKPTVTPSTTDPIVNVGYNVSTAA